MATTIITMISSVDPFLKVFNLMLFTSCGSSLCQRLVVEMALGGLHHSSGNVWRSKRSMQKAVLAHIYFACMNIHLYHYILVP